MGISRVSQRSRGGESLVKMNIRTLLAAYTAAIQSDCRSSHTSRITFSSARDIKDCTIRYQHSSCTSITNAQAPNMKRHARANFLSIHTNTYKLCVESVAIRDLHNQKPKLESALKSIRNRDVQMGREHTSNTSLEQRGFNLRLEIP